jgi:hypothetical protein
MEIIKKEFLSKRFLVAPLARNDKCRCIHIENFKFVIQIIIVSYLLSFSAWSQSKISISSSVNKTTIYIGDLITYSVKITHDEDVEVLLPSLGANLGGFEIRDYHEFEPRKVEDKIVHQVDYVISTFDVGDFEIPPIAVGYKVLPDTVEQIMKTESIKIVVESMKPSEDGDIREIKPPWEISFNWKPIVIIGIIAFFAILFVIAFIYVIKKRKKGEAIIPKKLEPQRPPHEIAYEELQRLADSDLLETGQIKLYYSEVSDIIRRYLEGRYQIIAMEMTTTEVLDQLRATEIEENHFGFFVQFLESCDLVKFAKYIPTETENEEIMKLAIQIVDETKWVEPVLEDVVEKEEMAEPNQFQDSEQRFDENVVDVSEVNEIEQEKKDVE